MRNNQVVNELARLSQTVRGLGRDASRHKMGMADIGLRGARQEYDINRQTKADARSDEVYEAGLPGQKLGTQQDVAASEAYNRPLTSSDLIRSVEGAEFMFYKNKDGSVNIDKLAKDLNYDADESEPGIIRYFRKGTNKPILHGEAGPEINAWATANASGKRVQRSKKERLDDMLRAGTISKVEHGKQTAQIKADNNNPTKLIQMAQARMSSLTPYAATKWGREGITKENARIEKLQAEIRAEKNRDKRAAERTKAVGLGSKSEKAGHFTLKNTGKPVTVSQLKTLYKQHHNLPDELELMIMEADPDRKADVEAYRKKISVNSFRDFVNRMTVEGDKLNWDKKGEQRTIVKTGKTKDGRKVVQYSDGTIEYAE